MFDHIGLKVKDIAASVRFYEAVLKPLGFVIGHRDETSAAFGPAGAPALWLAQGGSGGGVHVAFTSGERKGVTAFHTAGLAHGGQDNGAPGPRPAYGPNYFAGFLIDPDGNNVEAVCYAEAG